MARLPICLAGALVGVALAALPTSALDKPSVVWRPASAANFTDATRTAADIDSVVIHTAEGSYGGTISWFQNPAASASSHYVVAPDGEITQMVADEDVAWTQTYYNSRSLGIECAGRAGDPATWTPELLESLVHLVAWLCETYNLAIRHPTTTANDTGGWYNDYGILGHYQIQTSGSPAAARYGVRTDPGPHFPWDEFVGRVAARFGPGTPADLRASAKLDGGRASIEFSWSAAAGAEGYWLDIATDPGELQSMTGSFRHENLTGASFQWSDLDPGATYFWRVFAYNASGGLHGYPAGPVSTPNAGPPPAPSTIAPGAGESVATWPIVLDWTDALGASAYEVEIWRAALDGSWNQTHAGTTGISAYSLPYEAASENGAYAWRVRATSGTGESDWVESTFQFDLPAPDRPVLLSPKDWQAVSSDTPELRWENMEAQVITSFEIVVWRWDSGRWTRIYRQGHTGGGEGEFALPAGVVTRSGYYYWALRVRNAGGSSPFAGAGFSR